MNKKLNAIFFVASPEQFILIEIQKDFGIVVILNRSVSELFLIPPAFNSWWTFSQGLHRSNMLETSARDSIAQTYSKLHALLRCSDPNPNEPSRSSSACTFSFWRASREWAHLMFYITRRAPPYIWAALAVERERGLLARYWARHANPLVKCHQLQKLKLHYRGANRELKYVSFDVVELAEVYRLKTLCDVEVSGVLLD